MTVTPHPAAPAASPELIAPDTWLIPHLVPAGEGLLLPVNSMVIRGREPVIVDTGAPAHRASWLDKAFSVVEPEDVRWIFLSHDDGDHTGALFDVLERCPQATLVTNWFSVERLALEKPALPLHRMRWIEPGGSFDAGDRVLQLFRPPVFDGPTSRGLFDPKSGAMWIVDSFACLTPGSLDARELPAELLANCMPALNSAVSPWHAWLDPQVYGRHVDAVEGYGARTVASAHGPVLRGETLDDAFDRLRQMAGASIIPTPGQGLLDQMLVAVMGEGVAA
ncbi:MBL fold metallo-hydrolase [Aquincola sp. S2]|uniref:MBL fold metallo-hydrolase n=1 Tax=Pseudaquabacterium terrae TaxID=2732868 RepID=A0ABX2EF85_9BURK|nr:MBL fold metallo-hydrolase [Aquabacterium terrae]NRF67269.1 MBL fold metallo-hydrolase [Aquabacterium terrae]